MRILPNLRFLTSSVNSAGLSNLLIEDKTFLSGFNRRSLNS